LKQESPTFEEKREGLAQAGILALLGLTSRSVVVRLM